MVTKRFARGGRNPESGQAMLFTLLALGIFLIGAIAFAVDFSNIWFNRQSAQTAADAACVAGVEDLLVDTVNGGTHGGFTPGTAFDCNSNTTYAPCQYAALNGYSSSVAQGSTAIGDNVYVDFPGKTSAPPGITAPPAALAPTPFIRVTVNNNVPTFFAGMLRGMTKQAVQAVAVCGLQADQSPIPIIVLHPTLASSFSIQGGGGKTANIGIIGGPSQSVQVNSCSSTGGSSPCGSNDAANIGGSGNVNLCQAGPGFCGADMGVFGAEPNPGNSAFTTSCTGNTLCTGTQRSPNWNSPQAPISDPFAQTAAPTDPNLSATTPFVPSDLCGPVAKAKGTCATINSADSSGKADCTSSVIAAGTCYVDYQVHGCPDSTAPVLGTAPSSKGGCQLFTPGHYTAGIDVKNNVAVFDAGLYWLDTNSGTCSSTKGYAFCLEANSYVRPSFYKGTYTSTVPSWFGYNDGTYWDGGTIFYFHGTGSVVVDSNSGKTTGGGTTPDDFGNNAWQFAGASANVLAACPNGGSPNSHLPNPAVPNNIGGNILLAPCSISGTWGDPGTAATSYATDRGILFFQDRGNAAGSGKNSVQASWGGGGQFLLAGTMYFHQCVINKADTGTPCDTTTPAFNVQFTLGGGSGSTTYVLGEIIADQLVLGGGGVISMHLSPQTKFNILKASLLQ